MDSPIKNIDELLSGMLDGMLSEADLVELKREMADNPSLKGRLDDLAVLRRSLLSGRSTGTLRPNFASSITLSAKKRAAEMGLEAPAWLATPDSLVPLQKSLAPRSVDSRPWRRWIFAGGLTLAATGLFVLISFPKVDRSGIVSIPAGGEKIAVVESADIPEAPDVPESSSEKTLLAGNSEIILVAEADSTPIKSKKDPVESVAQVETVVSNPPPLDLRPADAVVLNLKDKAKEKLKPKRIPFYTVVMDVSIDPTAVENRTLERILEKYNIMFTDDFVMSDTQLKNLVDSNLLGNVANSDEKMGVMFLRSTGRQLDLALQDIIGQFEDFPDFAMDLLTDKSAEVLVKQLSSIKVADGADGFAKRFSLVEAPGNRSPFAASVRRSPPMTSVNRKKMKNGMILGVDRGSEMSNVLLLLRPAKK